MIVSLCEAYTMITIYSVWESFALLPYTCLIMAVQPVLGKILVWARKGLGGAKPLFAPPQIRLCVA